METITHPADPRLDSPVVREDYVALPVRQAWRDVPGQRWKDHVIAGTPGSYGFAGWSLVNVPFANLSSFMRTYSSARMPCWARFETGELPK